ncbi:unnamed protein product, partial [Didymodactylos carnosus]
MTSSFKRQRTEESSSTTQSASAPKDSAALVVDPATKQENKIAPDKDEKEKKGIIEPYQECFPRISVLEFFYTDKQKKKRDLFLRALSEMMSNLKNDDPWSYFAIAGIHGLPGNAYATAAAPLGRGYCEHGTVLFPTWHRPYVLLFEQAVIRAAKKIAGNIDNKYTNLREECMDMAKSLRVPYLDWESSFIGYQGIPDVFTTLTIDVTYPDPDEKKQTIPNPLRAYILPIDLSTPVHSSDSFNPTAKPHYHILEGKPPFTPANYSTVRHPNAAYQSQTNVLNLQIQRYCNLVFRPQVYAAMLQTDWAKFSNHNSMPGAKSTTGAEDDYGYYASLEVVHDSVHDAVGGNGGHMTYPE